MKIFEPSYVFVGKYYHSSQLYRDSQMVPCNTYLISPFLAKNIKEVVKQHSKAFFVYGSDGRK
jgi:hypothetical protein